jgi:putative SOS response-associated peptidase YedK
MCNRYGYKDPLAALLSEFSELGHVRWDGLMPNATDLLQIRPTDRAPIIRPADGEVELTMMRWGLVSPGWRSSLKDWIAQLRGNPLTNARSETVAVNSGFREVRGAPLPRAGDAVLRMDRRSGPAEGPQADVEVHRARPGDVRLPRPV